MRRPHPMLCFFFGIFTVSSLMFGQALQSGYVHTEGRRVYYEEKGKGQVLLLIHGFSLDSRMWDGQFDVFAKDYRVIRYDMSGYGRSSIPDSAISSSTEIAAVLKSLGVSRATVLGMSLGGLAAIRFAIDYPQMVEALITVGANLEGFPSTDQFVKRLGIYPAIARDSGLAAAKRAWLKDPFMTPVTNTQSVSSKIHKITADWSGIQFRNPAVWAFRKAAPPAIRRLHEIHVPTLVLVGENDDPNMRSIADTLTANIAGSRRVVVAGCGHLLSLERPDKFNGLVMDFLSGLFESQQ